MFYKESPWIKSKVDKFDEGEKLILMHKQLEDLLPSRLWRN